MISWDNLIIALSLTFVAGRVFLYGTFYPKKSEGN